VRKDPFENPRLHEFDRSRHDVAGGGDRDPLELPCRKLDRDGPELFGERDVRPDLLFQRQEHGASVDDPGIGPPVKRVGNFVRDLNGDLLLRLLRRCA